MELGMITGKADLRTEIGIMYKQQKGRDTCGVLAPQGGGGSSKNLTKPSQPERAARAMFCSGESPGFLREHLVSSPMFATLQPRGLRHITSVLCASIHSSSKSGCMYVLCKMQNIIPETEVQCNETRL